MMRRLVLGDRAVGNAVATAVADSPGSLYVVTDDSGWSTTLREAGIRATEADPTDPTAYPDAADVIVVAASDDARGCAIAEQARAAFPEATLLAVCPAATDPTQQDTIGTVADTLIEPTAEVAAELGSIAGADRGGRMARLLATIRPLEEPLAVVTHDNPDPDAIASAVALRRTAAASGCEVGVYYYGAIGHQENRALVNLLEFDLTSLEPGVEPDADGVALVDHSQPGVNDGLPETTDVDIIIDHHPPRGPVEGRFVDLRSEAGATSTLLVDYLDHFGVTPAADLATGLLFGIRTDTREFRRGVSAMDFEAAAWLLPEADLGALERVGSPSINPDTFAVIAAAVRNRHREGDLLLSCVGELTDRDALAQAADRLVDMEGVATTVVYGVISGTIHISARSRSGGFDLGGALREAFGRVGSAGGHTDMAGAQVTLGVLEAAEDRESLFDVVETFVTSRFLEAVETAAAPPNTVPAEDLVDRYLLWAGDGEGGEVDGQGKTGSDEPADTDHGEPGGGRSASGTRD